MLLEVVSEKSTFANELDTRNTFITDIIGIKMKSYTFFNWGVLFLLLLSFGGCQSRQANQTTCQIRFDSCYQFVRRHSLDHRTKADTLEKVLREMIEADTLLLTDTQRKQQVSAYRTLSSHYLTHGKHDLMLSYMIEGERKATQLGDPDLILSYSSGLLTLYSSWRLSDQTHYYIDRTIQQLASVRDTLARCEALMIVAGAFCNEKHPASALPYLHEIDAYMKANTSLLQRFPPNMQYLYPYIKGWTYTSLPDSAQAAIQILKPLYQTYHPYSQQLNGFDVICYNLGRCYTHLNQPKEAEHYYDEALSIVEGKQDLGHYDCAQWLMDDYQRQNDHQRMTRLLPTWNHLTNTFYNWCISSQFTAYYVAYQLAEKERELERMEWELQKRKLANIIYLMLLLFLLALCVWGVMFWRKRKRQMRQLFEALMQHHLEWKAQMVRLEQRHLALLTRLQDPSEIIDENNMTSSDEIEIMYQAIYNRALRCMEENHLFLNPHLTLDELAKHINTNRTQLSTCINRITQSNFNSWLAWYRVNHLLNQYNLLSQESTPLTLEELYEKSGFASRSSFYRQFKSVTGLTPSQFTKQQNQQKQE